MRNSTPYYGSGKKIMSGIPDLTSLGWRLPFKGLTSGVSNPQRHVANTSCRGEGQMAKSGSCEPQGASRSSAGGYQRKPGIS